MELTKNNIKVIKSLIKDCQDNHENLTKTLNECNKEEYGRVLMELLVLETMIDTYQVCVSLLVTNLIV